MNARNPPDDDDADADADGADVPDSYRERIRGLIERERDTLDRLD